MSSIRDHWPLFVGLSLSLGMLIGSFLSERTYDTEYRRVAGELRQMYVGQEAKVRQLREDNEHLTWLVTCLQQERRTSECR